MATAQIVINVEAKDATGVVDEFTRRFNAGMERLKAGASGTEDAFRTLGFSWTRVAESMVGFSFANFLTTAIDRVREFLIESAHLGKQALIAEEAFRQ